MTQHIQPTEISGILLRRAVLGILLLAGRPMTVSEIASALARQGATTSRQLTKGPSRVIADLLAHQVRIGRAQKTGPATFRAVPSSMSRSTRRRCVHWKDDPRWPASWVSLDASERRGPS